MESQEHRVRHGDERVVDLEVEQLLDPRGRQLRQESRRAQARDHPAVAVGAPEEAAVGGEQQPTLGRERGEHPLREEPHRGGPETVPVRALEGAAGSARGCRGWS